MMPMPQPQMPPQGMGAFQQAAQPPNMQAMAPAMSQLNPGAGNPMTQGQGSPDANMVMQKGRAALQALQRGAPLNANIMQDIDSYVMMFPQARQELTQAFGQNIASQGRGGDATVAHLTPGEMTVPPEVQTPKVLATLNKAYHKKGVSPSQFTVGSPNSSHNPSTGLPEYNFMSAFLPAALGIAGSIAAPYLAPELMSTATASSIGAGAGTALGGLAAGQTPTQAALSGLGAGVGGYAMGNLGNGLSLGGNAPASMSAEQQAILGAKDPTAALTAAKTMGLNTASQAAAQVPQTAGQYASANPGFMGAIQGAMAHPNFAGMAGSMAGGYLGGQIGAPPKPQQPNYPPGFNKPMTPMGSLPSAQTQLGQNISRQPMPSFGGFNPATNYPGSYNFFPGATGGM